MTASAGDIEHLEPDDDAPVGKVLSRREVLGILAGLAGAAVLAACDVPGSNTAQTAEHCGTNPDACHLGRSGHECGDPNAHEPGGGNGRRGDTCGGIAHG